MLTLLIKSTLRLLTRSKVLSSIKILGLATGAAIFLFTTRFSLEEISYDKQHPDYDLIYRYVHRVNSEEGMQSFAFTSAMTGPALKERFPEVSDYTRVFVPQTISVGDKEADISFNERRFSFVDGNFLKVFSFPVKSGNADLIDPLSLILTPSTAKKYFGDEDPIGKTLLVAGELEFTVKGVFREDFRNTHFDFDFVSSFSSLETIRNIPVVAGQIPVSLNLDKKGYNAFYTYLLLAPGSAAMLESKFPEFIEEFRGKGRSERLKPTLQRMQSIHLESDLLYEIGQNGSTVVVYVYFLVGLLVMLIACVNYVNISTAEVIMRARGIGLKKILGIRRSSLFVNYLGETVLVVLISTVLGMLLVGSLSPVFNGMVNRNIRFLDMLGLELLACISLLIVLLSGIYPALLITRTSGLASFKGNDQASLTSFLLRNALLFFQLVVSFCLITTSLLFYFQLDYLLSRDPGFDADQVMAINATSASSQQRDVLKAHLAGRQGIQAVGQCSVPPGGNLFSYGLTLPQNNSDEDRRILFYQVYVDADFLSALGVELDSGRFFDAGTAADSTQHIVINKAGAAALGEEIFTRVLDIPSVFSGPSVKKSVVGVINDFSFASFHQSIEPLALEYKPERCNYVLVRLPAAEARSVIETVRTSWKEIIPVAPFDYYFLDEKLAAFYDSESRQRDLVASLALLAIALASLGIFGTTLFIVQRRTKEVGIRKMLGSSRGSLLVLLARPLLILVVTSCIAGTPLSLVYGNTWLEPYPFRIDYSAWMFVTGFVIIAAIVIVTVLYHFLRLTRISPVETLRISE